MTWISLYELKFKAPVGVSEEEKKKQNDILVDLSVKVNTKKANKSDDISHTVDYQSLYNTTKNTVLEGGNLLEPIAMNIGRSILAEHKSVKQVKISVSKLKPPIDGDCGRSTVTMKIKR